IAIILITAKIFGEIAEQLKFSSLVGEVIAGITVGPLLGLVHPNVFLSQVASFGILFLLFLIGLNTKFDEFKKDIYRGSFLAVAGALISFVAGFMIGYGVFNNMEIGMVLGIAMLSSSTAISLRSLIDIGEFRSTVYQKLTAVASADDVLAVLALSLLTTYFTYGVVEIWKIAALFFAVLGFFFLILTVGSKLMAGFLHMFSKVRDDQIMLSIPLVIVFIVAFVSEHVGIAGVTGAFLAGMAMNRSHLAESVIAPKIKTIGYGFFIPLFFAYSALILDIGALVSYTGIIVLLVIVVSLSKLVGCGFFGKIYNFEKKEQLMIGLGMVPRGEYSIIVAQVALTAGVLTQQIYTIVIAVVLLTIIITPILFRFVQNMK
ncbi:MAG: cation:proton antiporter, partial [Candidatus Aenigmatarchaeota archaeon]